MHNVFQQNTKRLILLLMLSDPVHLFFFDRAIEPLFALSRLVFPLYAFMLGQNLAVGANPKKYAWSLFLMGAIAQWPYAWLLSQYKVHVLNVLFTLLCATMIVWGFMLYKRLPSVAVFLVLVFAVVAVIVPLEYGVFGVGMVLAAYAIHQHWAWGWGIVFALSFFVAGDYWWVASGACVVYGFLRGRVMATTKVSGVEKWFHYVFYPAHFALLALGVFLLR